MPGAHRILVVDDDNRVRRLVARYLAREGYRVREAADGHEMRSRLASEHYDLIILDLILPGDDGLTLAREIRIQSDVPIIMLTGKADTVDKVVGLEVGADDYVTKPFDERELLARVRTILRRNRSAGPQRSPDSRTARFNGWLLDLGSHDLVSPHGERVNLTTNEFELLCALVTHPNRVLSRDEILNHVSGRDWSPLDRSIDVLVGKLRRKIESNPKVPSLIKTIRGAGYKFTVDVEFA